MNKDNIGFAVVIMFLFSVAFVWGFMGVVGHEVRDIDESTKEILGSHVYTWEEFVFGGPLVVFVFGMSVIFLGLVFLPDSGVVGKVKDKGRGR